MSILIERIMEMKSLQDDLDAINESKKLIQERYDALRLFEIPAIMAEMDSSTSVKGAFGRCTLTTDLGVKVLVGKPELHEYLKSTGNEALIVPTVNAQTLKAFVKEQMIAGRPVPDNIVEAKPFSRAVLYKS